MFLYAEELEATSPTALAEQVRELGCNAASVAVVYHRARRVFPRQHRIHVLGSSTTYFQPVHSRYGALTPSIAAATHLCARVREFRDACDRVGLSFRAWVVPLHDEALAAAHPEVQAHTIEGSPNGIGICPSSPAAVEFAAGLVEDVCAQLAPDTVDLEAAFYPAWEPSYTLTLSLEPLSIQAQLLAAQCFCDSCRELFGSDAELLERRTLAAAGPPFSLDGDRDEELLTVLARTRRLGAERLVTAAAGSAHAQDSTLTVFASGPAAQASLQGVSESSVAAADRLLIGCGTRAGDQLLEHYTGLRALVGGRRATASMNWSRDRTPASMAADAESVAAAGADGLALYNLSLVPEDGLQTLQSAAAAFRDAAEVSAQ